LITQDWISECRASVHLRGKTLLQNLTRNIKIKIFLSRCRTAWQELSIHVENDKYLEEANNRS
jgi:hypothetical protein